MGKIRRKHFVLLLILPIFLGIFGACEKSPPKTGTLLDFVPENTSVVFKISNWETLQADINSNSLLQKFEKTPPYSFFAEKASLLKKLHPGSQSLLCINKINDSVAAYTYIAHQTKNGFQLDSIKNKTIETLKIDVHSFQRITVEKEIAYAATIDSVLVVTSSQQLLQDILQGKTERDSTFKKVFNLPTSNEFTALVRGNSIPFNDTTKVNFASWSSLDISITPESFTATGIALATDSVPQFLNVFEGQVPQETHVSELVPADALGAISFTFNDAEKFLKKLRTFRGEKENAKASGVFGSGSEVGEIHLKNDTVIFLKSIDAQLTQDALARYVSSKSNFREIEISSFSEPQLFSNSFSPFIHFNKANYVFQLENFFVFTEDEAVAQQVISAFQNNSTLKNTSYYKNTFSGLSTASSLLILKMQGTFGTAISRFFNSKSQAGIRNNSFEKFPLAALQFSFDRNFAHVTFSCKEVGGEAKSISGNISEKFHTNLESAVLGSPHLFSTNGGSNVVVQDMSNTLYFISESGKILWTKILDGAILGKPHEIDIFGNGNKQLAFATKHTFYILDRNGNNVKHFPITFKDAITQPLSVFDYDSNHNYRFVIVQGKEVLMYDKNAKIVKGFDFQKAKSTIVQSPVHIRMHNKDYIVIAEENGTLNILSRVGRTRVPVSEKFKFSEIPIAEEDKTFVVITKDNTKVRISENGKISSQKLAVGSNYWFAIEGNTKATLDDNLLRIDGKLVSLPLGLYTKPQIFIINRKPYITITETQEKQVYVFDKNGTLLNGFPVYGTSAASLDEGSGKSLNLATKGELNGVILYSNN